MQVQVLHARLPEAHAALEKLASKAKRLGLAGPAYTVGEPYTVTRELPSGHRAKVAYVNLTLAEELVKAPGHEFLAHVELTPGGVLVDAVPGTPEGTLASFRTTDARCDHCGTARRRKDVYVVREVATGALKQIGRSCLQEYMGIDPAQVAARFGYFHTFVEEAERFGMRAEYLESILNIMAWTSTIVRVKGWVSGAMAREAMERDKTLNATSGEVHFVMGARPTAYRGDDTLGREWDALRAARTPEDDKVAQDIVDYIRSDDFTGGSEYVHNLKVLFGDDVLTNPRRLAILVSAYAAWARATEQMVKRAARPQSTEHLGTVGDRLRDLSVVHEGTRVIGASDFGTQYLQTFRTESGALVKWFTGRPAKLDVGAKAVLTGTVKGHGEYRGQLETVVTRCKVQ